MRIPIFFKVDLRDLLAAADRMELTGRLPDFAAKTLSVAARDLAEGAARSTSEAVIDNQIDQAVKEENITESYGETLKTTAREKLDKLLAEIEILRQKVAAG